MQDKILPAEHVFQGEDTDNCGPCSLVMAYSLLGQNILLQQVQKELNLGEKGESTYPPQLARNVMKHGLKTKLTISNSFVVSPAWATNTKEELIENLKNSLVYIQHPKWHISAIYLLFYLQEGGILELKSYTSKTIKDMLDKKSVVIACVDEVWLWGHRFTKHKSEVDDLKGKSYGHFVVVTGFEDGKFKILDPYPTNLANRHGSYLVDEDQFINASLTWSATLLEVGK